MSPDEITGQSRSHIIQYDIPRFAACPEAGAAFLSMADKASEDDITLIPFSAFRDFQAQSRIWDMKYSGERPLLDQNGHVIPLENLDDEELVMAILRWSALPGASRHHWGTEIDVVDGGPLKNGYRAKLIPEEYGPGGEFYSLNEWLTENMAKFGFFRPYARFQGGVNPEPWHISFGVISRKALERLSLDLLRETIDNSQLMGKQTIMRLLPQIYRDYVLNISSGDD